MSEKVAARLPGRSARENARPSLEAGVREGGWTPASRTRRAEGERRRTADYVCIGVSGDLFSEA